MYIYIDKIYPDKLLGVKFAQVDNILSSAIFNFTLVRRRRCKIVTSTYICAGVYMYNDCGAWASRVS